jgi:hypothetical protein
LQGKEREREKSEESLFAVDVVDNALSVLKRERERERERRRGLQLKVFERRQKRERER